MWHFFTVESGSSKICDNLIGLPTDVWTQALVVTDWVPEIGFWENSESAENWVKRQAEQQGFKTFFTYHFWKLHAKSLLKMFSDDIHHFCNWSKRVLKGSIFIKLNPFPCPVGLD